MTDNAIPLTRAREQLTELVGRVLYGGERIVLTRHGKPAAVLVSVDHLERLDAAGRAPDSVDEETLVSARPNQVWRALIEPRLRSWWAPVRLDPVPGSEFDYLWLDDDDGPRGEVVGTVLEVIGSELLKLSWTERSGLTTEVSITLAETEGGTRVAVRHAGTCDPAHRRLWAGCMARLAAQFPDPPLRPGAYDECRLPADADGGRRDAG